jgi:predicted GNAT family acetyltransferase
MLATVLEAALAEPLMARWLDEDPELPGLNAPQPVAAALAAAWERLSGGRARAGIGEALHELERVIAPARPAPGRLRAATSDEQEMLIRWTGAFLEEAGIDDVGDAGPVVARSIRRGGLFVWEHGEPVSMLGLNPAVAGVVRVGPVYTPAEHRNRGYASSAVAAASELALARGATRCTLFTDRANPTSNRIYAALGYERRGDWQEFDFVP